MTSALVLLGQAATGINHDDIPNGVLVIVAVALTAGVFLTAIVTGIKYASKERELLHIERLKAIDHGILLDAADELRRIRRTTLRLAAAIGVVVPTGAVVGATVAVINMEPANAAGVTVFLIWSAVAVIGLAAVTSGAWLAQSVVSRLGSASSNDRGTTSYPAYAQTLDIPGAAAR